MDSARAMCSTEEKQDHNVCLRSAPENTQQFLKCLYHTNGCDFEGNMAALREHRKFCRYDPSYCPNDEPVQCGQINSSPQYVLLENMGHLFEFPCLYHTDGCDFEGNMAALREHRKFCRYDPSYCPNDEPAECDEINSSPQYVLLENMGHLFEFPCLYHTDGCDFEGTMAALREHRKFCRYDPSYCPNDEPVECDEINSSPQYVLLENMGHLFEFPCLYHTDGCDFEGTMAALREHRKFCRYDPSYCPNDEPVECDQVNSSPQYVLLENMGHLFEFPCLYHTDGCDFEGTMAALREHRKFCRYDPSYCPNDEPVQCGQINSSPQYVLLENMGHLFEFPCLYHTDGCDFEGTMAALREHRKFCRYDPSYCPNDEPVECDEINSSPQYVLLENMGHLFEFPCLYHTDGCDFEGTMAALREHRKFCRYDPSYCPNDELVECDQVNSSPQYVLLENMSHLFEIPCLYHTDGCDFEGTMAALREHRKFCRYDPSYCPNDEPVQCGQINSSPQYVLLENMGHLFEFPCLYHTDGCDFEGTMAALREHRKFCRYDPSYCPNDERVECDEINSSPQYVLLENMGHLFEFPCLYHTDGCDFEGNMAALREHRKFCRYDPSYCPSDESVECVRRNSSQEDFLLQHMDDHFEFHCLYHTNGCHFQGNMATLPEHHKFCRYNPSYCLIDESVECGQINSSPQHFLLEDLEDYLFEFPSLYHTNNFDFDVNMAAELCEHHKFCRYDRLLI